MTSENVMSALSKFSTSRSPAAAQAIPYDDLREKVAALFRPDRPVASGAVQTSPRAQPAEVAKPVPLRPNRVEAAGHELGSAVDILGRATSYFELLTQRLENVESEKEEAFSQLEEHKRALTTWQEMIETAQARMRDAERDLVEMRQDATAQARRAEAAEARCKELEQTLLMQDRRIEEIDDKYKSLHEQVMASFGLESPTYRSLEALVDRFRGLAA